VRPQFICGHPKGRGLSTQQVEYKPAVRDDIAAVYAADKAVTFKVLSAEPLIDPSPTISKCVGTAPEKLTKQRSAVQTKVQGGIKFKAHQNDVMFAILRAALGMTFQPSSSNGARWQLIETNGVLFAV
jgi:hypothetical protein